MLVLSRHRDEEVVINGGTPHEITITIVEIRGDKVRLGISADPEIKVHRREVYDAIQREKRLQENALIGKQLHVPAPQLTVKNGETFTVSGPTVEMASNGEISIKDEAVTITPGDLSKLRSGPLSKFVK